MNLKEIFTGGLGLLAVLLTLVEVTPIKINPLSWLAGWLGKSFNRTVLQQITDMEKKLEAMEGNISGLNDRMEETAAKACRARILRFGDEVLHGQLHTQDHFDQILLDIREYDAYCAEHKDFENNITGMTSERIKEVYRERLKKNDFL